MNKKPIRASVIIDVPTKHISSLNIYNGIFNAADLMQNSSKRIDAPIVVPRGEAVDLEVTQSVAITFYPE